MKRRMKNLCDERRYRVGRRAAPQHLGAETVSAEAGQKDKGDEVEVDSRCSRYTGDPGPILFGGPAFTEAFPIFEFLS